MNLFKIIIQKLKDDRLKNIDANSPDLVEIHHKILSERKYMQDVFREIYRNMVDCENNFLSGEGLKIEIGASGGFLKKYYPEIITSDIKPTPYSDIVVDALSMPFEDNTVKVIFGINCFHHFNDPDIFFNELKRVLVSGGGCILCEPYYGWFSSIFYNSLHEEEYYDKKMQTWKNKMSGPSIGANQALSYIVFKRDFELFSSKHPELKIVYEKSLNNYLRYIVAGGLNFKPLLPYRGFKYLLKFMELLLMPFRRYLALHNIIVIKKK
jgi:SAM-dependent methyltransferase